MSKKRAQRARGAARGTAQGDAQGISRTCLVHGWIMVTLFLTMGLVLESFHLVKLPFYVDVHLRRELWTLAHAHGTLLGAITVLFGLSVARLERVRGLAAAGKLLRAGSVLVPVGFLLGGVGNSEGDPSLFILLVPTGGALALLGLAMLARALRRA